MNMQQVLDHLNAYGPIIIFGLSYLESLNLSGIPATIIMPSIGVYIGQGSYSFSFIFLITTLAGVLGNITYYWIAYKVGSKMYDKVYYKFPKTQKPLSKAMAISKKYGDKACFVGRLIPGVRAFISLISGIFKIDFKTFMIYSLLGIVSWNFITIFIGYLITERI